MQQFPIGGKFIVSGLSDKKMTQKELAETLGVSQSRAQRLRGGPLRALFETGQPHLSMPQHPTFSDAGYLVKILPGFR